jgi:hypothetical protein
LLISLALFDPKLNAFVSAEERKCLQQNVMIVEVEKRIRTDTQYHFNFQVQMTLMSKQLPDIAGGYAQRTPHAVTSTKLIRDEHYNVSRVE